MAGVAMTTGSRGGNQGFARKLASSDKSTREKAVALLSLWLSCQQEIGEDELKKIWKGLFYCIWHSDKAPVQAELVEKLAGLLGSVDVELAVSFFKVFVSTMRREWAGIDRLRLDKYYLLLRKFLSHMFKVLDANEWERELVTKFMDVLKERAFLAVDRCAALGVNLHFIDVFWDEFRKFLPVPEGILGLLLEPFYSVLSTSVDKTLLRRVREGIFSPLLEDARVLVNVLERKEDLDGTTGSLGYLLYSTEIAPRLFELASSPSTAQANRKILYELHEEFNHVIRSLNSVKGVAFLSNGRRDSVLTRQDGKVSTENAEDIGKPHDEAEGCSRTRLRNRQARAAALGVKLPSEIFKVKKAKKAKKVKKEQLAGNGNVQENVGKYVNEDMEHLQPQADVEEEGGITIENGNSKISVGVLKMDVPLLKAKSAKRKGKKKKKGNLKLLSLSSLDTVEDTLHELETDRNEGGVRANGHQDAARALSELACSEGSSDIGEVTANLEKKFDFVAAENLVGPGPVAPPSSMDSSWKTRSKEKGMRCKTAAVQGLTPSPQNGKETGSDASPTLPALPEVGVGDRTLTESVKKAKKVRFALRYNLICKPHAPLPPLSVRTPPAATPRGSALKSGVPPGPIRTRPIRVARGSGLVKSRKRASRQLLTMSMQKTKKATRKLRKRQKL